MDKKLIVIICYVSYLFIMSIVAFFLYKKDKKMAQGGGGPKRIKEKTLLGVAALGGAIGAEIGRRLAHHKTDKGYFSLTIYFSLLLEIAFVVLFVILMVAGK